MSTPIPSPDDALIEAVRALAAAAEDAWRSGEPARLPEGLRACDQALAQVQAAVVKAGPEETAVLPASLAGVTKQLWLQRGHMLDALATVNGDPKLIIESLRSYDQAIGLASQMESAEGFLALAWMSRGKGLQRLASPEALTEALRCYDETIALLGEPPGAAPAELRNTLGAALVNRAGLLQRGGSAEALAGAAAAFERAITCFQACGDHPLARRNLASAWTNLGLLRQSAGDATAAIAAQVEALAVIDLLIPLDPEGLRGERATILLNLGQARCAAGDLDQGLAGLRAAVADAAVRAERDPGSADTVLRARHALGVTLGAQLAASPNSPSRTAWLEEAGDAVEDGLALLRQWGERAAWFAAIGTRLYEFGAWFYRTQQPRFLGEFLLEHLGEDPERARIAAAAVKTTREAITQRSFTDAAHDAMERALDVLQGLGEVEARLKTLGVPV